ncbi:hypothetical protein XH97_23025 [Bradyrhizobium sp. CCBAU 53380]|nr:hypothetical protein [Bradyrhizobium sp. CCBAU 53380]
MSSILRSQEARSSAFQSFSAVRTGLKAGAISAGRDLIQSSSADLAPALFLLSQMSASRSFAHRMQRRDEVQPFVELGQQRWQEPGASFCEEMTAAQQPVALPR